MEQSQEEAKTPKSSSSPSWLDLQDELTELILERLPLLYYLRFAAVCRKWRSIQRAHRLRHFPSPPPMAPSLPWLIVPDLLGNSGSTPECYSPFDQTLHRLRLPSPLPPHVFVASAHGWLLFIHGNTLFPSSHVASSLLNPITGHHILLPQVDIALEFSLGGTISAPPSDPRCTVLIAVDGNIFLHRRSDNSRWIKLDFPESRTDSFHNSLLHCAGKFYCVSEDFNLYVIDPFLPMPSMHCLDMDTSQLLPSPLVDDYVFLELNGEISAVVEEFDADYSSASVILFRADLSKSMWVTMEDIGDQTLFVSNNSSFSLLSEELGCEKNSIYFSRGFVCCGTKTYPDELWKMFVMFNLETKSFLSEQPDPDANTKQVLLEFDKYYPQWFLPRLDYINSSEASSSGSREESNKMNIFLEKRIC